MIEAQSLNVQGRRKDWKFERASSNVVGKMCPLLVGIGLMDVPFLGGGGGAIVPSLMLMQCVRGATFELLVPVSISSDLSCPIRFIIKFNFAYQLRSLTK